MRSSRQVAAPALVLGAVVSVQFGQALGKQMFGTVEPMGVAALRLGLAAVVLLALHRPTLPRSAAELGIVAAFGTAIAGMNLIYPALQYLPLGLAISLQLLGPITLALLASRRALDVCLAALAGCGIWLFHGPSGGQSPLPGVLLALGGGVSMALYLLLSSRAGARSTGGGPLALAVTWASLLTVPFGAAQSGTTLLEPRVLAHGLLVALVSAALPYSLELAALRRLPPRVVGVLQSLEPAAAGLAGTLLLSEHLNPLQWLALACVGAAAAGTVARPSGPRRPAKEGDAPASAPPVTYGPARGPCTSRACTGADEGTA
ncbi:EamA family transporter [Streptomyces sp. DSM 42041]|uniref:EamA family transporter n=1 Tax=Streptomyces hazeniae TaxID=3075538 RepID=A0ABU2NV31_9ACTN|nr:EamA family transporter [Streptomyces sp. DSM 42041]MDT0380836.1 EamA family transporter [Streptomyces sp. DSM 42041]